MDIGDVPERDQHASTWCSFLCFAGFFVLGFAQGTIRRLIGIASVLFSFLFAANVAEPLGRFLGDELDPVHRGIQLHGRLRLTVFVACVGRLRAGRPGLLQAAAAVREGALRRRGPRRHPGRGPGRRHPRRVLVILDTFFLRSRASPADATSCPFLRELWDGARRSRHRAGCSGDTLIPAFFVDLRVPRPGLDRGAVPEPRVLTAGCAGRAPISPARSPAAARRCSARASSATTRPVGGVGRIVEVEAYVGPDDRASHARFGRPPATRSCSGPPGIAYVYLVYGMYDCLNVVTGADGDGRRRAHPRRRAARGRRRDAGRSRARRAARRRRLADDPTARRRRASAWRDSRRAAGQRAGPRRRGLRPRPALDRHGPVRSGRAAPAGAAADRRRADADVGRRPARSGSATPDRTGRAARGGSAIARPALGLASGRR